MNVTCPNCATIYRVDPSKVPAAGVRARCAVCSAIFPVRREAAESGGGAGHPSAAAASPKQPEGTAAPPAAVPAAAPPAPVMAPLPPPASPAPPPPAAPTATPAAAPAHRALPPRPAAPPAAPPASAGASASPAPAARPAPALPPRPAAPSPAPAPARRPVNPFLSQDPSQKARRLARALISDMVVYHPAKRREGIRDGTLKQLFEEEIKKSWEEYSEQVGRDVAETSSHFRDALNEILADGKSMF